MMNEDNWSFEHKDAQTILRCAALGRVNGLAHAFSTRSVGESESNDMGGPENATEECAARRARFLEAAGLGAVRPVLLKQVHGARVIRCPRPHDILEADGIVLTSSDGPGVAPSIRTADCVPIIVADREGSAAAVVHSGWRGTAAGIVVEALRHLGRSGLDPARVVAALGPAIGRCCYEVGPEVVEAVAEASGGDAAVLSETVEGRTRLDLHEALRLQLVASGVPARSIHGAPWCTSCRDDLFFSYRRDGAGTGRQMASIAFKWASP